MMFDAGAVVVNIKVAGGQTFQAEITRADAAVKDLDDASKRAGRSTEDLGNKQETAKEKARRLAQEQADAARKARELADAQDRVGRALLVAGAAVVATTALTVRAAIQWESAWAGVTKTVDGTEEELAQVNQGLRDLTRVLPASHTEIAAVAEAAGQLGVQTKNVVAFTRTMIDLGETTNLSANDAATSLARFMNVMGTAQGEVSNLGSAVVELGNNYATTEAEIVQMAQRLSGAAKVVGMSEGEVLGLATALSSVGIEAEAGGSAVSKVMIDIAASVDAGGDRLERFARIAGMSAQEFTNQWRTNPGAALAAFVKGLADAEMQGESTLGMLAELGITEVRMRDALLRSAAASDQFTAAMRMGNKAYAENNALQAEAEKRYETVESKLSIMQNRINDAAIDFGSVFLPVVADLAAGVAGLADGLAGLPEPVQNAIAVGSLFAGVLALVGGAALVAVPKIAQLKTALNTLGTSTRVASAGAAGLTVALTVAVGLFSAWMAREAEAKASTEAFAASLHETTGALTAYTRELVAKRLEERGALEIAERAGISQKELTDAVLEGGDALDRVRDKINANYDATLQWDWATLRFRTNSEALTVQMFETHKELSDGQDSWERTTEAIGDTDKEAKNLKPTFGEVSAAAADVSGAIDGITQALRAFNDAQFRADDAMYNFHETILDLDELMGEKGFTGTLNVNTREGVENHRMLTSVAEATNRYAADVLALTNDQDAANDILEQGRKKLAEVGERFGLTGDDLQAFIDKYIANPTELNYNMALHGKTAAEDELNGFMRTWDGKRVNIFVDAHGGKTYQVPGTTVRFNADGAVYAFAGGGMRENHVAQIARAGGDIRVWAEPETGGEAYIPLSPAKRSTSVPVLAETAARMGFSLTDRNSSSRAEATTTTLARTSIDELVRGITEAVMERSRMDNRMWGGA